MACRYAAPILLTMCLTLQLLAVPAHAAVLDDYHGLALRELAQREGLAVGAGVHTQALADPVALRRLVEEFNSLTPANAMKWDSLQPQRGVYNFASSDAFVGLAAVNGMAVRGHTLVWHAQAPPWLSEGSYGRDEWISILRDHIHTVVGRYKGRIAHWDVVNEAVADDGSLRRTFWWHAIGPEYIDLAFHFAHEADPAAKLYYNDYGGEGLGAKSGGIYALITGLRDRGVPVHGVGLQMHRTLFSPTVADVSANMQRYESLGVEAAITEIDVAVPLPATHYFLGNQARAFAEMLDVCLAAQNCNSYTVWGITDRYSDKTRPDHGADSLFDEYARPKPAYWMVRRVLGAPVRHTLVMEAENFHHRPSNQQTLHGVALWSTGDHIRQEFVCANTGEQRVVVLARGTPAGGEWPTLRVESDDHGVLAEVSVTANSWRSYATTLPGCDGYDHLTLTFTNDAVIGLEDRNVEIDAVTITPHVLAEQMESTVGYPTGDGGWVLDQNGELTTSVNVGWPTLHRIEFQARGDYGLGDWPRVRVLIDGVPVGQVSVSSADMRTYSVTALLALGPRRVSLAFVNDAYDPSDEDRNVYVLDLVIHRAPAALL